MLETLKAILGIAFIFGVVIFVHELGHFVAAKLVGVYAPRFSIGFGRALWSRKWGETEYILAAIPLGGYVRMASREDETMAMIEGGTERTVPAASVETVGANSADVAEQIAPAAEETRPKYWDPNGLAPFGPRPVPTERLFESKPLLGRLFIMIAGVTMNFVLSLSLLTALASWYGRYVIQTRSYGGVPSGSPAAGAVSRLSIGDTIVSVDAQPVSTWDEVQDRIAAGEGRTVRLGTQRGEVVVATDETVTREVLAGAMQPFIPAVIDSVTADKPAARAGFKSGDSIMAIGGEPVRVWDDAVRKIQSSPGQAITFDLSRATGPVRLTVTPEPTKVEDPLSGATSTVGKIGAGPRAPASRHEAVSFPRAARAGWRMTWGIAGSVVDVLKGWVTGSVAIKQLGGPIAIASASAQAAQRGMQYVLQLLAILSINVAIFNLLPIPILDGGQILLNVVEAARGRAFSERTREYILRFGLVAIALLLAIGTFNDVSRGLSGIVRRLFG